MTKVFASPAEFAAAAGTHVGVSEWVAIEQDRIDLFADATGDHQWIHVDPERAADARSARASRTATSLSPSSRYSRRACTASRA